MVDSNCIAIRAHLPIWQTLQTMSDIYGIYMCVYEFFIIEWIVLNVMAYMMKHD